MPNFLLPLLRYRALRPRELCSKLADSARHFFYRGIAKSQDQTLARKLAQIRRGERPEPETLGRRAGCNFLVAQTFGKSHCQMHARLGAEDLQLRPELLPDAVDQRSSSFAIKQSHLSDVARKMSFAHKVVMAS